tara:strand:- start:282 stop:2729 length:2448 start_codon:yes stop_codon:yes gene_type:complete
VIFLRNFLILIGFIHFFTWAEEPPSDLSEDAKILWDYLFAVPPQYSDSSELLAQGRIFSYFPKEVKKELLNHPSFVKKLVNQRNEIEAQAKVSYEVAKKKMKEMGFDPDLAQTIYLDFEEAKRAFERPRKLSPHEIRNQAMSDLGFDSSLSDDQLSYADSKRLNDQMLKIEVMQTRSTKKNKFDPQKWWIEYKQKNYQRLLEQRKKMFLALYNRYEKQLFYKGVDMVQVRKSIQSLKRFDEFPSLYKLVSKIPKKDSETVYHLISDILSYHGFLDYKKVPNFKQISEIVETQILRGYCLRAGCIDSFDITGFYRFYSNQGEEYWKRRSDIAKKLGKPDIFDVVEKRFELDSKLSRYSFQKENRNHYYQTHSDSDAVLHRTDFDEENKVNYYKIENGEKGFYVERTEQDLLLTQKVDSFPAKNPSQKVTQVKSVVPMEIHGDLISILTPPEGRLQNLSIRKGSQILSPDQYEIFEMKTTEGVLVRFKDSSRSYKDLWIEADFIKKEGKPKSVPPSISQISSEKLKEETKELRQGGFIEWADDLDKLTENKKTVSREDIRKSFFKHAIYTKQQVGGKDFKAKGKYAKWSALKRDGKICVQCTSSNQLNEALMNELFPENTRMMAETGFLYDGQGHVGHLDKHRRNVIRVKDENGYTDYPDDSTPRLLEEDEIKRVEIPKLLEEEKKTKARYRNNQKLLERNKIKEVKENHYRLLKKNQDLLKNSVEKEIYQLSLVADGLAHETLSLEEASKKLSKIARKPISKDREVMMEWIQERASSYGPHTRKKLSQTAQEALHVLEEINTYFYDPEDLMECLLR